MATKQELAKAAAGLTERVEKRRVVALEEIDSAQQARLGQFFTPQQAATLLASLPSLPNAGTVRVLDPGSGVGSLAAALAARVLSAGLDLDLVAVEVDEQLATSLETTLGDIEETFRQTGRTARTALVQEDYVAPLSFALSREDVFGPPFDVVIMNPPYMKLASNSLHRQVVAKLGADCPNLYAAFLAVATLDLHAGGQLVAITPRSFANGTYFTQFRSFLLEHLALDHVHVFESRSKVFADTGVLQENVVFNGTRQGKRRRVVLSVSHAHTDEPSQVEVPYETVIQPDDPDMFIRILAGDGDSNLAAEMAALPATLGDLGIQVSTGRVVDFRFKQCLAAADAAGSYPLIYPGNVRGGRVEWPRAIRKHQGFVEREPSDAKLLLPKGNYVVVKRFSAKEERRRLVAAVWLDDQAGQVALENHLNYFHIRGRGLDRSLAVGLSYWLNSTLIDKFFRTFSGHTQVNAGDLRSLRFPSADSLRKIGRDRSPELPDQEEVDRIIRDVISMRSVAA